MINILHIITDSNVGGAGILLKNLVSSLDKKDFGSAVILPQNSLLKNILSPLTDVIPLDIVADKSFAIQDFFKYRQAIKNYNPDIVHTHGATIGRLAAKSLDKTTVMTRHCSYRAKIMDKFPFKQLNGFIYSKYTYFCIATADAAKNDLVSMGVQQGRIRIIINASPKMPRISKEEKEKLKKELNIGEYFVVGMVARLTKDKGHKTVIDAASLLRKEKIKFLFLGTGEIEQELKSYARKLDNVVFLGFHDDVYRYMNIFDLLVNASTGTETSCLAISEAMSLGIPCIASDYGGNPYMVQEKNGMLFRANDSYDLTRKIHFLFKNRNVLSTLSFGSLKRYESDFSVNRMADEYKEVYQRICAKNS